MIIDYNREEDSHVHSIDNVKKENEYEGCFSFLTKFGVFFLANQHN